MDVPSLSPQKSPIKRSSTSPSKSPTKSSSPSKVALPDPNLRLHANSICAKDAKLSLSQGPLTLRSNSVIHPKVHVTTPPEGMVLGRCSIVGENCVIDGTTRIGDYVLIEAGCRISAGEIGDDCVIENAVVLGEGAVVGANCRICAGEVIEAGQVVPPGTIVFSNGRQRKDKTEQVKWPRGRVLLIIENTAENAREAVCMVKCEFREIESSLACPIIQHR